MHVEKMNAAYLLQKGGHLTQGCRAIGWEWKTVEKVCCPEGHAIENVMGEKKKGIIEKKQQAVLCLENMGRRLLLKK